jgi:toxin ParE1/3/4
MKLRILAAAEIEVELAYDYYELQWSGLGRRIIAEVRDALEGILTFPEAHPILDASHRRRNLKKFPYAVFYRIEHDENVFVAFFHQHSDPQKWENLLENR